MSFERLSFEELDILTPAQETESWDRQRTSEELRDFVSRRLAKMATAEEVEIVA